MVTSPETCPAFLASMPRGWLNGAKHGRFRPGRSRGHPERFRLTRRLPASLLLLLLAFAWSAESRAQEPAAVEPPPDEATIGAHARVRLPLASRNPLDPTVAGTTVALDGRAASGETLREVLVEVPGARVLSTGAIGQFNAISLRGTELGQTTVMIDDLPIGGPDIGPVDLSLLPLAAFESIEVYRGGAPAWLSDGAIGGVVRLVPRRALSNFVAPRAEAGSFGTYRGQLALGVSDGPVSLAGSFGVLTSRQDFRFRNENGTLFDPSDDFDDRQRNAEVTQTHQFVRARTPAGRGQLDLVYLGLGRDGGYPGAGLRRTIHAHQRVGQNLGLASYRLDRDLRHGRSVRVQARMGLFAMRNEFSDPYGGSGLGAVDSDDRTRVVSGRLAATLALARSLDVTAIGVLRQDHVDLTNHASIYDVDPANRRVAAGTVEARLHGEIGRTRIEARSSYQLQSMNLRAQYVGNYGVIESTSDVRLLHTGRFGIAVSPRESIAVQASVHRGVRAPSILELFGNRSTVVANPDLLPESGVGADLGLVLRTSMAHACIVGELRGFVQAMDDVIVIVPTSQYQARATNLERALSAGVELGSRITIGEHVDVAAQWSMTHTRDGDGKELPNRPRQHFYARPTVSTGTIGRVVTELRGYVDLTYVGPTYLARSEQQRRDARTWIGAGVELALFDGTLLASLSVRDAADVGGTDYLGYPLSGRNWSGTASYRKEFP